MRLALLEPRELDETEGLSDAAGLRRPVELAVPQAEGDVLLDGEVREEGVVLEDHVHGPQVGRRPGHVLRRRCGCCPRSAARSHRSSAAAWSCRSRKGRAGRRTRPLRMSRVTASTAAISPKRFERFRISTLWDSAIRAVCPRERSSGGFHEDPFARSDRPAGMRRPGRESEPPRSSPAGPVATCAAAATGCPARSVVRRGGRSLSAS